MEKELKRNGYTVRLSDPILYVDNERRKRSGHMSHAMAEFAPGKIIDFNSNCSAAIHQGDAGEFFDKTDFGTCFYSNNLLLKDGDGKEHLLIQYSHSYFDKCVNVRHMWLSIEKN